VIRCYIADRHLSGINQSFDWIQIRDKQLPARELVDLSEWLVGKTKVIINSRMDVALAVSAAGVHLPANSPTARFRAIAPKGFLIGVSCHNLDEVREAEQEGADYVFFGPVFAPLSKQSDLAPRGIDGLAEAVRSVKIPVFALGGITLANSGDCERAGAAGIAAISLFESC
jgi:thiamine-phosphate pyrophosphorylase